MTNKIISRAYFAAFLVTMIAAMAFGQQYTEEVYFENIKISSGNYTANLVIDGISDVGAATIRVKTPPWVKVLSIKPALAVKQKNMFDSNINYKLHPDGKEFSIAWASLQTIPPGKYVFAKITFTIDPFTFNIPESELANGKAKILLTKFGN
jgi:hypothetical protein